MTLVQAQQRFVDRVNGCHTGHVRRVRRAAWKELRKWAEAHGYEAHVVCRDANDVATLERAAED